MTGNADGFPRSLSEREAEILDLLLGVDDPRIEPLRDQRAGVVVTGLCGCGCASIHLAVDRERSRPARLCHQPISAAPRANLPTGEQSCGVDLFLDDGFLSSLEICWIETPPTEFPPATSFEAPEVMCERHEAALAELDREPPIDGRPG